MKVAVIGGRDFKDYELVKKTLSKLTITVIVSGGALGADLLAERYADENNIPKKIFLPDWKTYGKIAGFLRNTDIINEGELTIAFWDGESKGTKDSINKARNLKKRVIIVGY